MIDDDLLVSDEELFLKGLPRRQQRHKKPDTSLLEAQTSVYRWWWEYLRLSKDYWLVCQTSERGAVKTDDQQLRRVYRAFGDIYSCTFEEWWLERGYRLFTEQEKFPKVVEVHRRPSERKRQSPAEDKIWVEVPLKLSRRTIQKQLGKLLDEYESSRLERRLMLSTADFKINPVQFGTHTLKKMHEVHALHRELIAKPQWMRKHKPEQLTANSKGDLFRIGKFLRLSPGNESLEGDPEVVRLRINRMRIAVSRIVKRSELIIANVEQGIFPNYKPAQLQKPKFTPRQLAQHKELEAQWWQLDLISELSRYKLTDVTRIRYEEPDRTRQMGLMLDPRERRVIIRDA